MQSLCISFADSLHAQVKILCNKINVSFNSMIHELLENSVRWRGGYWKGPLLLESRGCPVELSMGASDTEEHLAHSAFPSSQSLAGRRLISLRTVLFMRGASPGYSAGLLDTAEAKLGTGTQGDMHLAKIRVMLSNFKGQMDLKKNKSWALFKIIQCGDKML